MNRQESDKIFHEISKELSNNKHSASLPASEEKIDTTNTIEEEIYLKKAIKNIDAYGKILNDILK